MKIPARKLALVLSTSIVLAGCASIGPPEPPSLELPKPPTDLRGVRKGDKVTFTWTIPARTMDRKSVRYLGKTRICRSLDPALVTCDAPIGEVDPPVDFAALNDAGGKKTAATYAGSLSSIPHLDTHQQDLPATVTYAVEVLNQAGRSAGLSNQVHVTLAKTLPPPADFAVHLTGQGVVLTWTGPPVPQPSEPPARNAYRVFRREEGSQKPALVGEVPAAAGSLSLTDQGMEWEKTYYYHADSLTIVAQPGKADISVEGDDTPEVQVFAHDVFPPAVPSGLQAVFSGPGHQAFIDLIWSPVTDADLAGYNVYRHEEGAVPVKVNTAPAETPSFRDANVAGGKKYFYSVSAVDQRGNESARSDEASESVP